MLHHLLTRVLHCSPKSTVLATSLVERLPVIQHVTRQRLLLVLHELRQFNNRCNFVHTP